MDTKQALLQAQNHIQNNQVNQARAILRELIRQYPDNKTAWVFTSCVTNTIDQSIYCLQKAIALDPESQVLPDILQRVQYTGKFPTLDQFPMFFSSKEDSVDFESLFSDASILPSFVPSNQLNIPTTIPEKIYFRDHEIYISDLKIVFSQTTIPLEQIISSSMKSKKPILQRILGILIVLAGCVISGFILSFYIAGRSNGVWIESSIPELNNMDIALILSYILIIGLAISLFLLIPGLLLLLIPKTKYAVSIQTASNQYAIANSKNEQYISAISDAINSALADRGPYIPQSGFTEGVFSSTPVIKIAVAWLVLILSFGIPFALIAVGEQETALAVGGISQLIALVFGIVLSKDSNLKTKSNGKAIITVWSTIEGIGFCIGFFMATIM
jgi:hypothetical protein